MGFRSSWYRRAPGAVPALLLLAGQVLTGQTVANVLLVVNDASKLSRDIGQYYASKRGVPPRNICHIRTMETETIAREQYDREISAAITACLVRNSLTEQILYIVTTGGVPLRVAGSGGSEMDTDGAAVDSELALLYTDMKQGQPHALKGPALNPFFGQRDAKFAHPQFPIYLVTRLSA